MKFTQYHQSGKFGFFSARYARFAAGEDLGKHSGETMVQNDLPEAEKLVQAIGRFDVKDGEKKYNQEVAKASKTIEDLKKNASILNPRNAELDDRLKTLDGRLARLQEGFSAFKKRSTGLVDLAANGVVVKLSSSVETPGRKSKIEKVGALGGVANKLYEAANANLKGLLVSVMDGMPYEVLVSNVNMKVNLYDKPDADAVAHIQLLIKIEQGRYVFKLDGPGGKQEWPISDVNLAIRGVGEMIKKAMKKGADVSVFQEIKDASANEPLIEVQKSGKAAGGAFEKGDERPAEKALRLADEAFGNKKYEGAKKLYKEAISIASKAKDEDERLMKAQFGYAECFFMLDDYKKALPLYTDAELAAKKAGNEKMMYVSIGRQINCHFNLKNYKVVVEILTDAMMKNLTKFDEMHIEGYRTMQSESQRMAGVDPKNVKVADKKDEKTDGVEKKGDAKEDKESVQIAEGEEGAGREEWNEGVKYMDKGNEGSKRNTGGVAYYEKAYPHFVAAAELAGAPGEKNKMKNERRYYQSQYRAALCLYNVHKMSEVLENPNVPPSQSVTDDAKKIVDVITDTFIKKAIKYEEKHVDQNMRNLKDQAKLIVDRAAKAEAKEKAEQKRKAAAEEKNSTSAAELQKNANEYIDAIEAALNARIKKLKTQTPEERPAHLRDPADLGRFTSQLMERFAKRYRDIRNNNSPATIIEGEVKAFVQNKTTQVEKVAQAAYDVLNKAFEHAYAESHAAPPPESKTEAAKRVAGAAEKAKEQENDDLLPDALAYYNALSLKLRIVLIELESQRPDYLKKEEDYAAFKTGLQRRFDRYADLKDTARLGSLKSEIEEYRKDKVGTPIAKIKKIFDEVARPYIAKNEKAAQEAVKAKKTSDVSSHEAQIAKLESPEGRKALKVHLGEIAYRLSLTTDRMIGSFPAAIKTEDQKYAYSIIEDKLEKFINNLALKYTTDSKIRFDDVVNEKNLAVTADEFLRDSESKQFDTKIALRLADRIAKQVIADEVIAKVNEKAKETPAQKKFAEAMKIYDHGTGSAKSRPLFDEAAKLAHDAKDDRTEWRSKAKIAEDLCDKKDPAGLKLYHDVFEHKDMLPEDEYLVAVSLFIHAVQMSGVYDPLAEKFVDEESLMKKILALFYKDASTIRTEIDEIKEIGRLKRFEDRYSKIVNDIYADKDGSVSRSAEKTLTGMMEEAKALKNPEAIHLAVFGLAYARFRIEHFKNPEGRSYERVKLSLQTVRKDFENHKKYAAVLVTIDFMLAEITKFEASQKAAKEAAAKKQEQPPVKPAEKQPEPAVKPLDKPKNELPEKTTEASNERLDHRKRVRAVEDAFNALNASVSAGKATYAKQMEAYKQCETTYLGLLTEARDKKYIDQEKIILTHLAVLQLVYNTSDETLASLNTAKNYLEQAEKLVVNPPLAPRIQTYMDSVRAELDRLMNTKPKHILIKAMNVNTGHLGELQKQLQAGKKQSELTKDYATCYQEYGRLLAEAKGKSYPDQQRLILVHMSFMKILFGNAVDAEKLLDDAGRVAGVTKNPEVDQYISSVRALIEKRKSTPEPVGWVPERGGEFDEVAFDAMYKKGREIYDSAMRNSGDTVTKINTTNTEEWTHVLEAVKMLPGLANGHNERKYYNALALVAAAQAHLGRADEALQNIIIVKKYFGTVKDDKSAERDKKYAEYIQALKKMQSGTEVAKK